MTKPLTKSALVRSDIAKHPGATNNDVAARTGISAAHVASVTSTDLKHGKMARKQISSTISNAPIYAYWIAPDNVPSAPDNVLKEREPKERRSKPRVPAGGLDGILDQFARAVALELAGRIKDQLIEELQAITPATHTRESVRPLLAEIQQRIAAAATPTKARLPKVVVIGLLPAQAGMIQSEFHDVFEFDFWKDGSPSQLKDMVRGAEHVIIFSGKSGHYVEEVLKSAGKPFHRVMGGMTQLRDLITSLYVKEG